MLLMNAITSSLPKQSLVLPCKFIKIWHLSFITYASRFVFEGVQIKDCIDQSCKYHSFCLEMHVRLKPVGFASSVGKLSLKLHFYSQVTICETEA